jgi:alcohol dehydrogenase class IV
MWFFRSPEIVFGECALDHLACIKGHKALIITDENIVQLGHVAAVQDRLVEAGIDSTVFAEVEPGPSVQIARQAAEVAAAYEPDWIIGLGGGSCMDTAKAAWFIYERPDVDPAQISLFETFDLRKKARFIAIPTTSGTGSDATFAAVLTDQEERRKVGLATAELVPDLAIVDPCLVSELPPQITADTGMDALTHAVEGCTSTWHNDFSDGPCLKAIQLVFDYLPRAYKNGASDSEAREKMHNAASIAGLGFGNSMAALAHAMGHALEGVFHIPHGRSVGLFLPYAIEFAANGGNGRYAGIARFLGLPAGDDTEAAASLVTAIRTLLRTIDQPTSVRQLGIALDSYNEAMPQLIANAETDTQIVTSPRIPDGDEMKRLFQYAYEGKSIDF